MKKENRELLKKRARAMAVEPLMERIQSDVLNVIVFSMGTETFGLESGFIREVFPMKDFTPLPGTPEHIFGLINVRGEILPVIDLKKILKLPGQGLGELNKVIILQDERMEFGILADVVYGTQMVEIEKIQDTPHALAQGGEEYLRGVTRENLILLNAEKLLSDEKLIISNEVY